MEKIDARIDNVTSALDFDSSYIEDWLENLDLGWGAQQIANRAAEIIGEKTEALQDEAEQLANKLKQQARDSFQVAINELQPEAKFQGDVTWKEHCRDEAQWASIAANPVGVKSVGANASGFIEIDISAGAGVEAEAKLKFTIEFSGDWKITRLNPVRPTSGSGATITVTATPVWEGSLRGKVTIQAGIGGSAGGEITFSDTLPDVQGTLTCPTP